MKFIAKSLALNPNNLGTVSKTVEDIDYISNRSLFKISEESINNFNNNNNINNNSGSSSSCSSSNINNNFMFISMLRLFP